MSGPLILAFLWAVAANLIGMLPSKRSHWPQAYALIALGIPILGWLTLRHGPLIGLLALIAGMSVLRWPLRRLFRWLGQRMRREP